MGESLWAHIGVNEWGPHIAPTSISKQCALRMPHTSEFVKHKFWDYIKAQRAWLWATFIIHDPCGICTGNYHIFN